jgi:hypothetical protein
VPQVSEAMDVLQENAQALTVTVALSLLLANSFFSPALVNYLLVRLIFFT